MKKDEQYVDLEEMNIILKIPKNAKRLNIEVILKDEKENVSKVGKVLKKKDIKQARQDFLDNVDLGDNYDGKYVLTEEGLKYLEELKKKYGDNSNDTTKST